jgi:hypothetical protein
MRLRQVTTGATKYKTSSRRILPWNASWCSISLSSGKHALHWCLVSFYDLLYIWTVSVSLNSFFISVRCVCMFWSNTFIVLFCQYLSFCGNF